jgi:hypothetical protein
MVTKRALALEALAALPALLLVVLAGDPLLAMARFDPLVVFRLLLLLWVLVHMWFIAEHLLEDLGAMRLFLADVEKTNPDWRVRRAGDRASRWSLLRVARFCLRLGWPTLLLAAIVTSVNAASFSLLAGWRPAILAPWLP